MRNRNQKKRSSNITRCKIDQLNERIRRSKGWIERKKKKRTRIGNGDRSDTRVFAAESRKTNHIASPKTGKIVTVERRFLQRRRCNKAQQSKKRSAWQNGVVKGERRQGVIGPHLHESQARTNFTQGTRCRKRRFHAKKTTGRKPREKEKKKPEVPQILERMPRIKRKS